jgi:hypothetical protein
MFKPDMFDFLAQPHGFLLNGHKTAKTSYGAYLSLILVASILAVIGQEAYLYFNDVTPIVIETGQQTRKYPNTTMRNVGLLPLVKLKYKTNEVRGVDMFNVMTPVLMRVKRDYTFHDNGTSTENIKAVTYPYKPCSDLLKNQDYEFAEIFRTQFTEAEAVYMLCPQYVLNDTYTVGNRRNTEDNTVLQFSIKPCSMDTGCIVDPNEMKQYEVDIMSQRIDKQYDNSNTPINITYQDSYITGLTPGSTTYNIIILKRINVWDNRGFPFAKVLKQSVPVPDEKLNFQASWRNQTLLQTCPNIDANGGLAFLFCESYYIMELSIGDKDELINRSYTTLLEMLSQVGGLVTIIQAALTFVYMIFHEVVMKRMLVKSVFKFLPRKDQRSKRCCCMFKQRKRRDGSDVENGEGGPEDAGTIPRMQKSTLDGVEYLHVTKQIYDHAYLKIKEHMDMATLITELFNLKILVNALLTNYNRRIGPLVILSNSIEQKNKLKKEKLLKEEFKMKTGNDAPDKKYTEFQELQNKHSITTPDLNDQHLNDNNSPMRSQFNAGSKLLNN